MISPAFSMATMSPMRMSLRAISSALCSVARATVVPLTGTGSRIGHRRQDARAADLDLDVEQPRLGALGLVFVRHRPARRFGGQPEPLALREIVHLDHRAVRFVLEIVPHGVEFADGREDALRGVGGPEALADLAGRMPSSSLNISLCECSSAAPPSSSPKLCATNASGRLATMCRVELLERTGGGVARVGEQRQPGVGAVAVELGKPALGQVHLAAHFQPRGQRAPCSWRGIVRIVRAFCVMSSPGHAVAARGGVLERAVFVEKRHRHAVDLRLDDDRHVAAGQRLLHAAVKLGDLRPRNTCCPG